MRMSCTALQGMLPLPAIQQRVQQFTKAGLPLVVTRAPLFTNKAHLFPKSTFVVGYDTAIRLVIPKYYGNSFTQMLLDFAHFRHQGCKFLVAGRRDEQSGKFCVLDDINVPAELVDIFQAIPESAFRKDISSTQLRQSQHS